MTGLAGENSTPFHEGKIEALSLSDLSAGDKVMIRTANSTYWFSISNPAHRSGKLSGGALGADGLNAILVATLGVQDCGSKNDSYNLKLNARAIFIVTTPEGPRHMVTSLITGLALAPEAVAPSFFPEIHTA